MTEARYRGQKVVVVSPDYSDHTKFADDWLAAAPGTDGALAMAMGHVILSEFFRDRQVPYFTEYVKTYTDLPFLGRRPGHRCCLPATRPNQSRDHLARYAISTTAYDHSAFIHITLTR